MGILTVILINNFLIDKYLIPLRILDFSVRQVLSVTLICFVVSFMGALIPVLKLMRKKPVDIIKKF